MYCEFCGAALGEKATFCPSCGILVKTIVKPVLAPLPGQIIPPSEPVPAAKNETTESVQNEARQEESPNEAEPAPAGAPYSYNYNSAPNPPAPAQKDNSWAGTVSLIMGILSLLSCGGATLCVILAVIFGIMGRKTRKRKSAIAGIILSVISVIIFVLLIAAIITGLMPSEFYYVYNGISSMYM